MSLVFSQEEVDKIRDYNRKKEGKAEELVDNIEFLANSTHISISEACKALGKSEDEYYSAKELLKDIKAAS